MKRYLVLLISPLLFSCGLYPQTPMQISQFPADKQPAEHLIILLSGQGASETYFQDNRWIEIAREHGSEVDFIAPYAHFGYYMTQSLLPRLNEDVIIPAKKLGYKTISIAGISMGGLGSILYSNKFPDDIDRIYLVSPYLGNDDVHDEIRQAGGLEHWQLKKDNANDWNYFVWQRLKEMLQDPGQKKKLFLGYGEQDRLKGHDVLAQAIPESQVIIVQGGHKDTVFTEIWKNMNKKGFL